MIAQYSYRLSAEQVPLGKHPSPPLLTVCHLRRSNASCRLLRFSQCLWGRLSKNGAAALDFKHYALLRLLQKSDTSRFLFLKIVALVEFCDWFTFNHFHSDCVTICSFNRWNCVSYLCFGSRCTTETAKYPNQF